MANGLTEAPYFFTFHSIIKISMGKYRSMEPAVEPRLRKSSALQPWSSDHRLKIDAQLCLRSKNSPLRPGGPTSGFLPSLLFPLRSKRFFLAWWRWKGWRGAASKFVLPPLSGLWCTEIRRQVRLFAPYCAILGSIFSTIEREILKKTRRSHFLPFICNTYII